ncbi:hypothetical protein [Prevotella nigrescens]|uniref:hypothetical protein n=2 Tax=Prevotella nigrescens TaxID=28133 RepID=UPI0018C8CDB6|nr:hypothetical protein [Prevotella nigrescens]
MIFNEKTSKLYKNMMAATDFFKTKFPIIALMMGFVPFYIEVYRQVSGVLRQTALLIISLVSTPFILAKILH